MIVASRFGWSAVAGPDRMSIYDLLLAVQLMSEEQVGQPHREYQRALAKGDERALAKLDRFKG